MLVFNELERAGVGCPEGYANKFEMERLVRLMTRTFPETIFLATHSSAEWFTYHGQCRLDTQRIEGLTSAGRVNGKDLDLWLPVYLANEELWGQIVEVFDCNGSSPDSKVELDVEGKILCIAGTICISPELWGLPPERLTTEVVRLLAQRANKNEGGCAAVRRTSFGDNMLVMGMGAASYARNRRESPYPFVEIVPVVVRVGDELGLGDNLEAEMRRIGYAPGAYRSVVFMQSPVTQRPEIFARYVHSQALPEVLDIPEELAASEMECLNWVRIQCKVFLSLLLIKSAGGDVIEKEYKKLETVFRVFEDRHGNIWRKTDRLAEKVRKVIEDIGVVSPGFAVGLKAAE